MKHSTRNGIRGPYWYGVDLDGTLAIAAHFKLITVEKPSFDVRKLHDPYLALAEAEIEELLA